MSGIKGKNTKPEILVRKIIHASGYRFRIHSKNLPGHPDVVLPRHKKIIFVQGCFWHGHKRCKRAHRPKTNVEFWNGKIDANIERGRKVKRILNRKGWRVLSIWECRTKNAGLLERKLKTFLRK